MLFGVSLFWTQACRVHRSPKARHAFSHPLWDAPSGTRESQIYCQAPERCFSLGQATVASANRGRGKAVAFAQGHACTGARVVPAVVAPALLARTPGACRRMALSHCHSVGDSYGCHDERCAWGTRLGGVAGAAVCDSGCFVLSYSPWRMINCRPPSGS